MDWILANWQNVLEIVAYVVFVARLVIVLTPTVKDDNFFLPIIKFIGKLGLDKYGPAERPK